jgi:anti-anti-sigma factor
MTVPIGKATSEVVFRRGNPPLDCDGALISAQCRHLATVVTISGAIDAMNIDRVAEYSRRFVRADNRLVLDLSGVDCFSANGISFLYRLDEDCRTAGVEWVLIAGDAVLQALRIANDDTMLPLAGSVPEALHDFADDIFTRRRLLLPLLTKSA